jgi:hypothetical protein
MQMSYHNVKLTFKEKRTLAPWSQLLYKKQYPQTRKILTPSVVKESLCHETDSIW